MRLLLVIAAYAVLFLAGELANRRFHLSAETTRTAVHMLSGFAAVIFQLWLTREELIGLAILFSLVLLVSQRLSLLRSIHLVPRTTWGEVFFPAGIGLAAYLYLPLRPHYYSLSVLIMALSDPLANIAGSRLKSRRLLFGKTLAGSVVFFLSSFAIGLFFLQPVPALLVSTLSTFGEALSPYGSDNLTVIPAAWLAALL